ncbi:MAG: hypothetical protein OXF47_06125 [Nitrospira sp.]|nr:hypothetical protein [Nitrospira sp.]
MEGQLPDKPKFEVVACIAGRGFGVRREDMKKLLLFTRSSASLRKPRLSLTTAFPHVFVGRLEHRVQGFGAFFTQIAVSTKKC